MRAIAIPLLIDIVRHMHLKVVTIEREIVPEVAASLCACAKASECGSNGYHRLHAMQC